MFSPRKRFRFTICFAAFVAAVAAASLFGPSKTRADEPADPFAKWEKSIAAFEQQDTEKPPEKGGIVFVGSSSIRMWKLDKSFPGVNAINRGFGGSELADTVHFAERIVFKYEPKTIVVYAGDNDIGKGKSPEQVVDDFKKLVQLVNEKSPASKLVYIAIKPSIKRWALHDKKTVANSAISKICQQTKNIEYVDVVKPMLGENGEPRPSLFLKDGLHMTDAGYELWTSIVKPYIVETKTE